MKERSVCLKFIPKCHQILVLCQSKYTCYAILKFETTKVPRSRLSVCSSLYLPQPSDFFGVKLTCWNVFSKSKWINNNSGKSKKF